MPLTILYDSQCPLCVKEMRALKARDHHDELSLVDIWQGDFENNFPQISRQAANKILHGFDDDRLLLGLDVTAEAWARVGVARYKLLRLPVVRVIADYFYRLFARHRYTISKLITGRSRLCTEDACHKITADTEKTT